MARDVFISEHRCEYCDRPASVVWDDDLFSCGHEICKTLAFTELQRRRRSGTVRRRVSRGRSGALRRALRSERARS
jgi:hypothetical protein